MSTLPNLYPLEIYQGDTFVLNGTYKEGATVETAVPVALTGATMAGQIRATRSTTSDLLAEFELVLADQVADPGVWTATLSAASATALNRPKCFYDIEIQWPSGVVKTILSGPVHVTAEVTV